jgi:hypothetical protein
MRDAGEGDLYNAMRMAVTAERIRAQNEAEAKAKTEKGYCVVCGANGLPVEGLGIHRIHDLAAEPVPICGSCIKAVATYAPGPEPDEFDRTVAEAPLNSQTDYVTIKEFTEWRQAFAKQASGQTPMTHSDMLEDRIKRNCQRLDEIEANSPGRVATRMVTALSVAEQDIVTSLHKVKDALRGEAREGASVEELAARKYFDSRKALTGQELCGDCGFRMATIEGSPLCRDYNKRTLDDICGYLTIKQSSRWIPKASGFAAVIGAIPEITDEEEQEALKTCPGLNAIVWFDAPTGRPVTKVTPRGLGMEEK